jgi:hypothetical protein
LAKRQRNNERISSTQAAKIHQLYRTYHLEICLIAERFGVDENAIKDVLSRPCTPPDHRWRVKWDDEEGVRHERTFESFRACKMFEQKINPRPEWSRVEPA